MQAGSDVACAVVPESHMVVIVETQCLGDGVDEEGIGHRDRDDVGEVDTDEVGVARDCAVANVADFNKDEEDDGDQEEEGGKQRPDPAGACCTFDLGWSGVGWIICEGAVRAGMLGSVNVAGWF